jgi:hypothetical protein
LRFRGELLRRRVLEGSISEVVCWLEYWVMAVLVFIWAILEAFPISISARSFRDWRVCMRVELDAG